MSSVGRTWNGQKVHSQRASTPLVPGTTVGVAKTQTVPVKTQTVTAVQAVRHADTTRRPILPVIEIFHGAGRVSEARSVGITGQCRPSHCVHNSFPTG